MPETTITVPSPTPPAGDLRQAVKTASTTAKRWFIGYVVFLAAAGVLTAVLTLAVWRTGSEEQKAVIALAQAQIEDAKRGAAEANSKAATIEATNLQLKADVGAAAERVARLETEAANAKGRAATAERQLLELKQRVARRRLTAEEMGTLRTLLSAVPGSINLECIGGDPEPCKFADELRTELLAAGWTIASYGRGNIVVGNPPEGILITVQDRTIRRAVVLQNALKQIGHEAKGEVQPNLPPDTVKLSVGSKPNP